jgi:hypothetical protein
LLDKRAIEVQWEEQPSQGNAVLNMVIGAFMALIFLGLPLAIFGLFIASTLDRRGGRAPQGFAVSRELSASGPTANHASDRRRRIIYGQYPRAQEHRLNATRPARVHDDRA